MPQAKSNAATRLLPISSSANPHRPNPIKRHPPHRLRKEDHEDLLLIFGSVASNVVGRSKRGGSLAVGLFRLALPSDNRSSSSPPTVLLCSGSSAGQQGVFLVIVALRSISTIS